MLKKSNEDLRLLAKQCRIPLWSIARELSVSEQTFLRYLRCELPADKKQEIRSIIYDLQNQEEK